MGIVFSSQYFGILGMGIKSVGMGLLTIGTFLVNTNNVFVFQRDV